MSSATAEASDSETVPESARVCHGGDGPAPSLAVVEAIADLAGVDPTDLHEEGVVLYDHVDPDALDALVASRAGSDVDVSLSVAGYDIHVGSEFAIAREKQN